MNEYEIYNQRISRMKESIKTCRKSLLHDLSLILFDAFVDSAREEYISECELEKEIEAYYMSVDDDIQCSELFEKEAVKTCSKSLLHDLSLILFDAFFDSAREEFINFDLSECDLKKEIEAYYISVYVDNNYDINNYELFEIADQIICVDELVSNVYKMYLNKKDEYF